MSAAHSFPIAIVITFAIAGAASAQHNGHGMPQQSPYAGLEQRSVKALSDQQIADLRAGRGIGLALAAELNGYPGPMHVLELADRLGLSDEQRTRVRALFDAMKAEAVPLGERVIMEETKLDELFSKRTVIPTSLSAATSAIGLAQGALREAHLKFHLATVEVLSEEQVRRYNELRGYRQKN